MLDPLKNAVEDRINSEGDSPEAHRRVAKTYLEIGLGTIAVGTIATVATGAAELISKGNLEHTIDNAEYFGTILGTFAAGTLFWSGYHRHKARIRRPEEVVERYKYDYGTIHNRTHISQGPKYLLNTIRGKQPEQLQLEAMERGHNYAEQNLHYLVKAAKVEAEEKGVSIDIDLSNFWPVESHR
jgi:hypothetical protein